MPPALTLHDTQGHRAVISDSQPDFFRKRNLAAHARGPEAGGLPGKIELNGMLDGQVIVTLNQDWTPAGMTTSFAQGSVVSLDLAALQKDPSQLKPAVVFAPTATEFAQEIETTRNHLLLTTLENVQGRAYVYSLDSKGEWTRQRSRFPTTNRSA